MRRLVLYFALCLPLPAAAQELIAAYRAEIALDDIYNSEGRRLLDVGQILQQDRANLHRWGIAQPGDEWDPVFDDAELRLQMPGLILRGWTDPALVELIQAGSAWVQVTAWGKGGRIERIDVTPAG